MEEVNDSIKYDCEYIFDESQSLFNITEDEYSIVINRKQSSDKTLLIERLRYVIDYEYGKYCNSDVRKAPIGEDFESYFHEISSNIAVLNAQEAISVLLKSYSSQDLRLSLKYGCNINKELLNSLKNEYWFDALLFYLLTHKTSTTAYRSLLNIINRYYGALSNLQYSHILDEELIRQLNVLYPFVIFKKDSPTAWSFSNDSFIRKIVIALYKNQECKRNDLFRIKRLLDSLEYTCQKPTNLFLTFDKMPGIDIEDGPSISITPWEIKLGDSKGHVMKFTISANIIESIRKKNKDGDNYLTYLSSVFREYYQEYTNNNVDDWSNILLNEAEILGLESWNAFLRNYLKELGTNHSGNDVLMPDYCYDYIVYRHVMAKPDLSSDLSILDNQLTDRLIDLLHKNQSSDQSRLYEDCFSLKFITSKINNNEDMPKWELAQNDPVWRGSLEFLGPILNDFFINTTVMSVEQVKRLIKNIISNAGFYEDMRIIPKAFVKYNVRVNANILLKIIYLLINTNVIMSGTPLFRIVKTTKLAAAIFKLHDKKEIDNMRKHITLVEDKYFTKVRRKKAQTIIDGYWKDTANIKKI